MAKIKLRLSYNDQFEYKKYTYISSVISLIILHHGLVDGVLNFYTKRIAKLSLVG